MYDVIQNSKPSPHNIYPSFVFGYRAPFSSSVFPKYDHKCNYLLLSNILLVQSLLISIVAFPIFAEIRLENQRFN